MRNGIGRYFVGCLVIGMAAGGVWGQGAATQEGAPVTALTISGEGMERPDLRYALMPKPQDMQRGNAAVQYHMAAESYLSDRGEAKDLDEVLGKLNTGNVGGMDEAAGDKIVGQFGRMLKIMREGARMDTVDWQLNIRKEGYSTLLPHLGDFREMVTVLRMATRLDIKRHRWSEAREEIQTGYAFARDMGKGDTIIEVLVGAAMAGQMNSCVQDWMGEEGSPNLFWPLATMPERFVSLAHAASYERAGAFFNFAEWRVMSEGRATADDLRAFAHDFEAMSRGVNGSSHLNASSMALALAMAEYPRAKRFFIEHGAGVEEVEKRSVASVVGEYFARTFEEESDAYFKWIGLPPKQAIPGMLHEETMMASGEGRSMNLLARILLPSLGRAEFSPARVDRQIAALRIGEGIRAYVAEHHGLPGSLEEMGLPLAEDPVMGKAFGFERRGNVIVLTADAPEGSTERNGGNRYEFTVRGE